VIMSIGMSQFKFQLLELRDSTPQEWLRVWAKSFDDETGDDPEYSVLIAKHESLSAEYFQLIGKWKDNAWAEGKW